MQFIKHLSIFIKNMKKGEKRVVIGGISLYTIYEILEGPVHRQKIGR